MQEKIIKHISIVKNDTKMMAVGTWEAKYNPKAKSSKYVPANYWNSSSDGFYFTKFENEKTKIHKLL